MPEDKYKVKTKPKKGQPLSAAQKQSVEQGTFERKVQPVGYKVKQRNASGVGATSKATREKLVYNKVKSDYRPTKPSGSTVKAKGAGGVGFCPKGSKNCKAAYGKHAK
jgi:hypothetical protein